MMAHKTNLNCRRGRQSGHQIIEFGLAAFLFVPLILGTFVTGMNVIRSIQVNHIVRDMANMYIHGADFSDQDLQQVAARLATGMDLRVGTGSVNRADNLANEGRGIVWISKVTWVGSSSEPSCQAVLPETCTNANKFVFLERIRFGNGALEAERASSLGHPTAPRNENGILTVNTVTDARAAVPEPQQTWLFNMWQTSQASTGRTPLADGQVLFVVEAYFQSPDLTMGAFQGRGVYAQWFF
jgi:Flp pilus assembly protein TadG